MGRLYLSRYDIIYNSKSLINPFKSEWKYNDETNCYAYALGLDIPVDLINIHDSIHYNPGYFGGMSLKSPFTEESLLSCLLSDMDVLDLECFGAEPDDRIGRNSWKVAIFGAVTDKPGVFKDFHFAKYETVSNPGSWTHKQGFDQAPKNIDSDGMIILDPRKCRIEDNDDGENYNYKYLRTVILSK